MMVNACAGLTLAAVAEAKGMFKQPLDDEHGDIFL